VIELDHCSAISNAQHGFRSDGFLGNLLISCHTSVNGSTPVGGTAVSNCLVSYGGATWGVVPQYENLGLTLPSTTIPGTNSAVWVQVANDTTTFSFVQPWTEGGQYQAGGGYCCFDGSLNLFGYTEGDQGPDYWNGQKIGSPISQGNFPGIQRPFGWLLPNGANFISAGPAGTTEWEQVTTSIAPQPGVGPYNEPQRSVAIGVNGAVTGDFWFELDASVGTFGVENPNYAPYWQLTGPTTIYTFGSGAPIPGVTNFPNGIGIGASLGAPTAGIRQLVAEGPPTGAAGLGWIVWNASPTPGGTVGWICTTGGAKPVWKTFGGISS
jgi:hypothetical protein